MNIRQLNSISEATLEWLKSQGCRDGEARIFQTPDRKYFIMSRSNGIHQINLSRIIEHFTEVSNIDELTTRYREVFAAPPSEQFFSVVWDAVIWIQTQAKRSSELRSARLMLHSLAEQAFNLSYQESGNSNQDLLEEEENHQ